LSTARLRFATVVAALALVLAACGTAGAPTPGATATPSLMPSAGVESAAPTPNMTATLTIRVSASPSKSKSAITFEGVIAALEAGGHNLDVYKIAISQAQLQSDFELLEGSSAAPPQKIFAAAFAEATSSKDLAIQQGDAANVTSYALAAAENTGNAAAVQFAKDMVAWDVTSLFKTKNDIHGLINILTAGMQTELDN
jgi:hypothetical protein